MKLELTLEEARVLDVAVEYIKKHKDVAVKIYAGYERSPSALCGPLSFHRNGDHDSAHDIVALEISPGAVRMSIMASNA